MIIDGYSVKFIQSDREGAPKQGQLELDFEKIDRRVRHETSGLWTLEMLTHDFLLPVCLKMRVDMLNGAEQPFAECNGLSRHGMLVDSDIFSISRRCVGRFDQHMLFIAVGAAMCPYVRMEIQKVNE